MSRWILVKRRKPPVDVSVLFAHPENVNAHVALYDASGHWYDWEYQRDINYEPTHWMPLPNPPKESP